ncbi:MAG: winged helix-turn-helix transcriptional regulator [Actinobacteria bacterium]|nr:winged helix-turn-helix transcriptional regulator [Actinomycetota bacterium]
MVRGQDILVLLKLLQEPKDSTMRSLAASVGLDPAGVHRALQRLQDARLVDGDGRRVNRSNAQEFLVHGVKYLFPVRQGGPSRGVPTAWAAPPLKNELASVDEPPPVWPDPKGKARGISLKPLHPSVPELARRDGELAEQLALIDAIRLGDGRIRSLASKRLSERVKQDGQRL